MAEPADIVAFIAPLFVLYDYSFHAPGTTTKEESLKYASQTGIVCTDEWLLHPDPYPTRDEWCRARVALTETNSGWLALSANAGLTAAASGANRQMAVPSLSNAPTRDVI